MSTVSSTGPTTYGDEQIIGRPKPALPAGVSWTRPGTRNGGFDLLPAEAELEPGREPVGSPVR